MSVVLSDAANDPAPEIANESLLAGPLDLGRQTRNLLLARPLHELAAKVRRADYGDGEFQDIDTHYLALAMFDFIMEGSVFGLGRLREDVTNYLADVVRQMKPALGDDRCNQLALEILNTLHNSVIGNLKVVET